MFEGNKGFKDTIAGDFSIDWAGEDLESVRRTIVKKTQRRDPFPAVGFEASAHGRDGGEAPATVLNTIMTVTRAGGALGIPGLYVPGDPGAADPDAKEGTLKIRIGLGWAKEPQLHDRSVPGHEVPPRPDDEHSARQGPDREGGQRHSHPLDQAPEGYQDFDRGAAKKYVLDPHNQHQKV